MRGKLRDKRATNKRDILKREVIKRRRINKRDNRLPTQLEQFDDDDYELEPGQAPLDSIQGLVKHSDLPAENEQGQLQD